MENISADKVLTPKEIKAQKIREWQREYRKKYPEVLRARCKAWRENNPEKNKESQKKAGRKYRLAHQGEVRAAARENAQKYYAEHRDEVLARQKIYRIKNREKIAERRRAAAAIKSEAAKQRKKANAVTISMRRKEKYRQNPQAARERALNYYARAMASRKMAFGVCPVFRVVMELKATKNIAYKTCGGAKYSFVQRAVKGCPALSAADAGLCPLVANPEMQQNQMLAVCAMPDVFKIPLAWPAIRAYAMDLRMQCER